MKYINANHTVSNTFNYILYADYTILNRPLYSFIHGGCHHMNHISLLIYSETNSADDIVECIFLNENVRIAIKISLKNLFIRVQSTIFQHWFREWLGAYDKPLSEPMMVGLQTHIYIYIYIERERERCVTWPHCVTAYNANFLVFTKPNGNDWPRDSATWNWQYHDSKDNRI